MERIKGNKPHHPFLNLDSDYQFTPKNNTPHLQSSNHQFLLKYASSIIQVVPEERLDPSSHHWGIDEHRQGTVEQSLIYGLESRHILSSNRTETVQNNSTSVTPMKRKVGNRKILTYNFSNLTILNEKIKALIKKRSREIFELIRGRTALTLDCYHAKSKKQMKRGSDCSGYTASTSNDDRPSKRQSKKLTENILKELKKDGANQLKGFLQFKVLMTLSNAFKCLATHSPRPFQVSQVSTIKCEPVENYQTADHSIEITREIPNCRSRSMVYQTDLNFEFTQKEVKIADVRLDMAKKNIAIQESFVENYKPLELHICSPKRLPLSKNIVLPRTNKPIHFISPERSREVWANVYELPLLSEKQLKCGKQRRTQYPSLLQDHFMKNQPQIILPVNGIMKDLQQIADLFKSKTHNKAITSPENKMEKHKIFKEKPKVVKEIEKVPTPMQRSTVKNEPSNYQSPQHVYKQRSPTILINQPGSPKIMNGNLAHGYSPQNIYQINCNQPKRVLKQPKYGQVIARQPQIRGNTAVNSPGKPFVSNYGQRQEILQVETARKDSNSKRSFYSPQVSKEYSQLPQRITRPLQVAPAPMMAVRPEQPLRQHNIQPNGRAVSFTNNYYFTGSQAIRPSSKLNEPIPNLFQQSIHRNNAVQPESARHSTQRLNIFAQSPMNSQLQQRERSQRFQKMRSDLSRPKSMNEKIFITLRRDK